MTRLALLDSIRQKKSFLCVGLDTDPQLIPKHLHRFPDPVYEFNRQIIDATKDFAVAYKPNLAFYEAQGISGWQSLEKTMLYLRSLKQPVFTIADAKRGDIGNTSNMYAKAFFEWLQFDAVTVAPYMGEDSVAPFLSYENKWVILLALTSNKGSNDFQLQQTGNEKLYERVLQQSQQWGTPDNMMYVVGATHPDMFRSIRRHVPNHFLLVPGIGAQGGDLDGACQNGLNNEIGLLINSSRQIIYASNDEDFAQAAAREAKLVLTAMQPYCKRLGV